MSGMWRDLYHGETHFDFVGKRRRWFTISAVLVTISILALLLRGLNLGVDFVGGSLVEVENPSGVSVGRVRDALDGLGLEQSVVQTTGGGAIRVQTEELTPEEEDRLVEVLTEVAGVDEVLERRSVGPTFGEQVAESAVRALVIFLAVVAVFISWRLEWRMAVAALVALGHDLLLTSGIYALVGFQVSPATVIAILTIMGYSLYDTVVVFDKVLENINERGERHTVSAIVNMSMNQVFMRSVNTSLTSLLPIGSLLFVGSYLLGAATLREFALALFIGVATGTYSSIFLAAPLLAAWKEREETWRRVRRRLARKGLEDDEYAAHGLAAEPEPEVAVALGSGAAPRAPKKRRKSR